LRKATSRHIKKSSKGRAMGTRLGTGPPPRLRSSPSPPTTPRAMLDGRHRARRRAPSPSSRSGPSSQKVGRARADGLARALAVGDNREARRILAALAAFSDLFSGVYRSPTVIRASQHQQQSRAEKYRIAYLHVVGAEATWEPRLHDCRGSNKSSFPFAD
jgi:hypothetical protein